MRIICGAFLLALLTLAPQTFAQPSKSDKSLKSKGPITFGGKTLSAWRQQLSSADASKRADAIMAVTNFEESSIAVPALLNIAAHDTDLSPRVRALVALRLVAVDNDQYSRVIRTLGSRLDRHKEPEAVARLEASISLKRFVSESDMVMIVPELCKAGVDRSSWEIRFNCVSILWRLGREQKTGADSRIYDALLAVMRPGETYQVRMEALQGLGALGRPSSAVTLTKVVSSLKLYSRSENKPLAIWAFCALVSMHDPMVAEQYLGHIAKFLRSNSLELRIQAASALGALNTRAKRKVPQLVAMLKDPEINAVWAAAGALASIGDANDTVVKALLELVDHKDPSHAAAAVTALAALRVNTPEVTKHLDKMLENKKLDRRLRAYIEDGLKDIKTPKKKDG